MSGHCLQGSVASVAVHPGSQCSGSVALVRLRLAQRFHVVLVQVGHLLVLLQRLPRVELALAQQTHELGEVD